MSECSKKLLHARNVFMNVEKLHCPDNKKLSLIFWVKLFSGILCCEDPENYRSVRVDLTGVITGITLYHELRNFFYHLSMTNYTIG